jgi:hypothetical protein
MSCRNTTSFSEACAHASPAEVFVHMRTLGFACINVQYNAGVKAAVEASNVANIKLLYAWWEINYGDVNITDRIPRIQSEVFRAACERGDQELIDVLTSHSTLAKRTSNAIKTLQIACEATDPMMSMRLPRLIGSII